MHNMTEITKSKTYKYDLNSFLFCNFDTNLCLQTILIAYFWCTAHRPWAVLNTFFFASCSTLFVFVCACVFVLYSSVTARLEFSRRWYDLSCFGGDQRRRQLGWSYLAGEAERTLLLHSTGHFLIIYITNTNMNLSSGTNHALNIL